jgi:two-component system phosphate regulon response regulator PhoB
MKILIIEDELDLAELIAFNLQKEGFKTVLAYDGRTGLERVNSEKPDLVILDLMLPEIGGIEICKAIRRNESSSTIPVLMVTAKGEEIDKVVGFEVGADDYLVKPFSTRELLLRVKAILRRTSNEKPEGKIFNAGMVSIDTESHRVTSDGEEITLTITEFKLLLTLMERLGRMQSREQLLDHVWGYSSDADTRTVDTHITRLRSKLGSAGDLIKTIRGFGYRMEEK